MTKRGALEGAYENLSQALHLVDEAKARVENAAAGCTDLRRQIDFCQSWLRTASLLACIEHVAAEREHEVTGRDFVELEER